MATITAGAAFLVAVAFLSNLVIFSRMEHSAAQERLYSSFRATLALGTAPISPVDDQRHLIRPGTPVALIRIPSLGVNEVVVEGTTSENLTHGPGHLRSSVLPGGPGISQIFGRAAAYGGPFGGIAGLRWGAKIKVITGYGQYLFRVVGVRHAGQLPAPLAVGASRLTLVTAAGTAFVPSGAEWVDADLLSPQPAPLYPVPVALSSAERAMHGDTSSGLQLVMWLQALLVLIVAATVTWVRWGRPQTVIVFVPCGLLVGYYIADQVTRLLPNLT